MACLPSTPRGGPGGALSGGSGARREPQVQTSLLWADTIQAPPRRGWRSGFLGGLVGTLLGALGCAGGPCKLWVGAPLNRLGCSPIWWKKFKNIQFRGFPGCPVVKTSPSSTHGASLVPSWSATIPHVSGPKKKKNPKHKTEAIL